MDGIIPHLKHHMASYGYIFEGLYGHQIVFIKTDSVNKEGKKKMKKLAKLYGLKLSINKN